MHSRGIKLLLQPDPRINNLDLFHTPIHPSSHFILLPHFRALIGNTFVMLPDVFQGPTIVLVIQCLSGRMAYSED